MKKNSSFFSALPILIITVILTVAIFIFLGVVSVSIINNESPTERMNIPAAGASGVTGFSDPLTGIVNPDAEVRGVWIASVGNIDFPSKPGISAEKQKEELLDIVRTVQSLNLNSIYFQVRPTADALYNSQIFPWSRYLTGEQGKPNDEGFDPLEYLVSIAHGAGIAVHAWVNPLRATFGTATSPFHNTEKLAANHPARLNPSLVVPYGDGKLYFNAGMPEVRQLVADGVAEIVSNYQVDGIVFDDYFYPYPVSGSVFDDEAEFELYGSGFTSIADWRRDNINQTVKLCYDTIKSIRPACEFGIAPFGVWQNNNGKNGGSDTKGFNSYSELYCDALAWAAGGYIDYIAPQIYWRFTTEAARYDVLTRWWNAKLSQYPGVKLLICHAAYRSGEWESDTEIRNQVEFARSEKLYAGSIMYGYAAIKRNDGSLQTQLTSLYTDEILYTGIVSDKSPVVINSPKSGSYMSDDKTYIIGKCDPAYPLYMNGEPVSVTKTGYFSVFVTLSEGTSTFEFTSGNFVNKYILKRISGGKSAGYEVMPSYAVSSAYPLNDCILPSGTVYNLKAIAPAGSRVTATVGGFTIELKPTIKPTGSAMYYKEIYTGAFTLPHGDPGRVTELGRIVYEATGNGESARALSKKICVIPAGYSFPIVVTSDSTELKISPSSWYYDDYSTQAAGMTDNAVSLENGYFKLRMGGYVKADNTDTLNESAIELATISSVSLDATGTDQTFINFLSDINIPVDCRVVSGVFRVKLFNVKEKPPTLSLPSNLLFSDVSVIFSPENSTAEYSFILHNTKNYYGFRTEYGENHVSVVLGNPCTDADSYLPLEGKTIIIDAGHGGAECGAVGPDPLHPESDVNLRLSVKVSEELRKLGANVIMTREDDVTIPVAPDRITLLDEISPDLAVSIHCNSMDYSTNITTVKGFMACYFADSGLFPASVITSTFAERTGRVTISPNNLRLAMVRNHAFPSVLLEVGFMTSVEEVEILISESGSSRTAAAISEGIAEYFRQQTIMASEILK